ncbi:hypothetical protein J6590_039511 [Homalodisca vitripennis]|nr:hypothetical protein J6590_039511 [Homalodisca vitripennis]
MMADALTDGFIRAGTRTGIPFHGSQTHKQTNSGVCLAQSVCLPATPVVEVNMSHVPVTGATCRSKNPGRRYGAVIRYSAALAATATATATACCIVSRTSTNQAAAWQQWQGLLKLVYSHIRPPDGEFIYRLLNRLHKLSRYGSQIDDINLQSDDWRRFPHNNDHGLPRPERESAENQAKRSKTGEEKAEIVATVRGFYGSMRKRELDQSDSHGRSLY